MKNPFVTVVLVLIVSAFSNNFGQSADWDSVSTILNRINPPYFPENEFDITAYGAVAGGNIDCTDAINKAIEACSNSGGGKVVVPQGIFLTGAIYLMSNVNLYLSPGSELLFTNDKSRYLPVVYTRYEGIECMNYSPFIYAYNEINIAVTGSGILDGQAGYGNNNWWDWKSKSGIESSLLYQFADSNTPVEQRIFGEGHYLRPNFIQPYKCQNVLIDSVTILRSPMWEIHPVLCTNVTVSNVHVNSYGPNNDGCNPESCTDVLIKNCYFNTGDDCIAIKAGRNSDGRRVNVPCQNIIIQDCHMVDGHGGITMGSEMTGGIKNVFAENCEMTGDNLNNVIRFKTNSLRGGTIENIHIRNITSIMDKQGTIHIEMQYSGETGNYIPTIKNIFINNLISNETRYAVYINDLPNSPVRNLQISNSTFNNAATPFVLNNAKDVIFNNVHINGLLYTDINNVNKNNLDNIFLLRQNYPNPFNPVTIIKYSLSKMETGYTPSLQQVVLKVYDILGREVETLVNETKLPGDYEVTFDANHALHGRSLSSGIYFYKLRYGKYISTKKMVLIK